MSSEKKDASTYLVNFLTNYTRLIEGQLLNIRETMVNTVENVMQGVQGISHATEDRRQHAEQVLEATYVNPDVETEILIQDLQHAVDNLFDQITERQRSGKDLSHILSTEPEVLVKNRISRFAGRFTGEMDALNKIDDDLKNIMFGIIGALSSEDVISQKLDHVVMSLKALQTGLNYVLLDYEQRCEMSELNKVVDNIKSYTFRQYTAEDEKQRFIQIFGAPQNRAS